MKSEQSIDCEVFIYGSTPGGISAALEAARSGRKVVLACPKGHLGGMSASGLCTTDAVRRHLFGAIVGEFIARVRAHYHTHLGLSHPDFALCQDGWHYEPWVAEEVFTAMVNAESPRLLWMKSSRLTTATVVEGKIHSLQIISKDGSLIHVSARVFIDGTYEGDLAAAAQVPYRVGREAREEFGEPLAGIHYMNWRTGEEIPTSCSGNASPAIQAFCARSILTDDPAHRIPLEKPGTYDAHLPDYLPLLDDFASGRLTSVEQFLMGCRMPRGKREVNGHIEALTSINCPGVSWEYPEAGYDLREELDRFHVDHAWGLFYFLQHDPHVPKEIAAKMRTFGLHDGEFGDNGHWPWQIYVRQGRRIRGRATVTQHNFTVDPHTGKTPAVQGAIATGEHSFDVHPCHDRRFARDGFAEGVLWYPEKARGPAQPGRVPYDALVPVNLDNLLVPVALSCTHVAMSVLRMEPVWMTLGQLAGAAAHLSLEHRCSVASLDPALLAL